MNRPMRVLAIVVAISGAVVSLADAENGSDAGAIAIAGDAGLQDPCATLSAQWFTDVAATLRNQARLPTASELARTSAAGVNDLKNLSDNTMKLSAIYRRCARRSADGSAPVDTTAAVTWARALRALVDTELKCRATPQCMTARAKAKAVADAVEAVCYLMAGRAQTQRELDREKANPSGVVNLARLHELGALLQSLDIDQIPAAKAAYAARAHRPFSPTLCH